MNQYLVDNQINLQYLTQLLQNSDFDIKKYQRRSNLLNADGLHSRELMNLFRAFQDHLISGLNRHRSSKKSQALPSSNELALKNAEPLQPVKFKDESQLELNQEQRIEIKSENQNECGSSQNKVVSKQNLRKSQQLRDKLNEREEKDIIRIEMDDQEVIEFPKQIQKHSFGQTKLILKGQLNQVSISVMRRLAFLSVSGCIGFDDSERAEFIKAAFLLKFDQFFEYLTRHIVMNLLDFGDNADEVLDILIFMWQTDLGRSEHYSDFISKLAISNPKLYKRKFEISPNILKLDVGLLESKLLPLIHKLLSSDRYLPQKQVRIIISQVVEYYQIHSGKKVYFPFLQQKAEEEVIQFVEKRFQNILKEFECSLCLKPFDNCHTTKCGHSFCKIDYYLTQKLRINFEGNRILQNLRAEPAQAYQFLQNIILASSPHKYYQQSARID